MTDADTPPLGGCGSLDIGRVGEDVAPPSTEESIVVLRVSPSDYTVTIFPGNVKEGKFNQDPFRTAAISGAPVNGFVVAKVSGGQTLALLKTYRVDKDGKGMPGTLVGTCGDGKAPTFDAPKGKVIYVGDIQYQPQGRQVEIRYRQDLESARKYIDSRYAGLRGRHEPGSLDVLPTTVPCTTKITIPIYLPSGR